MTTSDTINGHKRIAYLYIKDIKAALCLVLLIQTRPGPIEPSTDGMTLNRNVCTPYPIQYDDVNTPRYSQVYNHHYIITILPPVHVYRNLHFTFAFPVSPGTDDPIVVDQDETEYARVVLVDHAFQMLWVVVLLIIFLIEGTGTTGSI